MEKKQVGKNTERVLRKNLFFTAANLQSGSCLIFATNVAVEISEFTLYTTAELLAVIALAAGAYIGIVQYKQLLHRNSKIQLELNAATGAFQTVIEEHFATWQLTAAERNVALLSIKGVSIAEIAKMRQTRTGTIKAQNAAIYRKSGVSSRAELVSVMIEEMILGLDLTHIAAPTEPENRHPDGTKNQKVMSEVGS